MSKINDLRLKIDDIDKNILGWVIKRLEVVKEIGEIKKENGIEIIDEDREEQVMESLGRQAQEKGIPKAVIKKIWKVLMEISYEVEGGSNGNS